MSNENNTASDYAALRSVLDLAYEQSSSGKGKNRHANGKPFLSQPIMEIGRMVGIGYQLGQAMKKAQEAGGMASRGEAEAAQAELLGAINYLAAAHIQIGETMPADDTITVKWATGKAYGHHAISKEPLPYWRSGDVKFPIPNPPRCSSCGGLLSNHPSPLCSRTELHTN